MLTDQKSHITKLITLFLKKKKQKMITNKVMKNILKRSIVKVMMKKVQNQIYKNQN